MSGIERLAQATRPPGLNGVAIELRVRGRAPAGNLLLVRCGRTQPLCLLDHGGLDDTTVVLSLYQEPEFQLPKDAWVFAGGLSKFHAAKLIFQAHPELLEHAFFAFFDPDVAIGADGLARLFATGRTQAVGLFQAAVAGDAFTHWPFLFEAPGAGFRETSLVEVMAPVFARTALDRVRDAFDLSVSTWGLEYQWYAACRSMGMGVQHGVVMRHDTPVDTLGGPFYTYLRSLGIDALEEKQALRSKYAGRWYIEAGFPPAVPRCAQPLYLAMKRFKNEVLGLR